MSRFVLAALAVVAVSYSSRADDKPTLEVLANRMIPRDSALVVTAAGSPAPKAKDHKPLMTITRFGVATPLPDAGPFDLYLILKKGLAIKVAAKWTPKPGANAFSPGDQLGWIEANGDDLPRVDSVVVTWTKDDGPGAKSHVAVQTADDYRSVMLVPAGTYDVWIVPANGSKSQRIASSVRVQAGRTTVVPE